MEQHTSCEADSSSNGQEILDIFMSPKGPFLFKKPILYEINPGKAIPSHFF
jgi:hypothetical protein